MTPLLVVLGAALGAPARFWLDQAVQRRHDMVFPWGTLLVNVTGSLALGVVVGAIHAGAAPPALGAAVGTGFCGAFTTFSSFGFETVRLVEDGSLSEAAANVVGNVVIGLLAAAAGWALAGVL